MAGNCIATWVRCVAIGAGLAGGSCVTIQGIVL